MIVHTVMWKLKNNAEGNTKEKNAKLIKEKLEALYGKVKQIKKIEVGVSYNHGKEEFDVILISEFETKKDLEDYQNHPLHKIVSEFVGKVRSERYYLDYEK